MRSGAAPSREGLEARAVLVGIDLTPGEALVEDLLGVLTTRNLRAPLAALTRGAKGSLLVTADGRASDLPGTPVDVVDTVGAGDAFTAAVTLGLLAGWPLARLHAQAERVAAFVCTQAGGTPPIPAALRIG